MQQKGLVRPRVELTAQTKVVSMCRHLDVLLKKHACPRILPYLLSHTGSLTHTHTRTHTIKQSASDQSQRSLPSPPPTSLPLSPLCSLGCKHYPSNGSLEDTKTSSYLTPDTNLRVLNVVYLGIKHTHTRLPELAAENRRSSRAISPPNTHTHTHTLHSASSISPGLQKLSPSQNLFHILPLYIPHLSPQKYQIQYI